jgi:hypothetical protein
VYLTWRDFSADPSRDGIVFTRSTDDGRTWGPNGGTVIDLIGGRDELANELPFVTVGPDHAVYVFWWQFREQSGQEELVMRKSTDQGVTFGDTVLVTDLRTTLPLGNLGLTDSGGNGFRTGDMPQAAVNPVTGDLYLVFHDKPQGSADRGDVFFVQSTNGGKHWSKPLRLNDDATQNDQWMPALALTPDGRHVGVFWYDRRLDPANNLIDRFGVIGTVEGHHISFGDNFRITDVSFPPAFGQDPLTSPDYMGDYDMATADNDFFYTTWGDNRLGNAVHAHQPDVRLARIPVICSTASDNEFSHDGEPTAEFAALLDVGGPLRPAAIAHPTATMAMAPTRPAPPASEETGVARALAAIARDDRRLTVSSTPWDEEGLRPVEMDLMRDLGMPV